MTEELAFQPDEVPDVVNALAASQDSNGVCFAARNTGLYRSSDGGATWYPAYDSLELIAPLATTAVALSPAFRSDQVVFAGFNGAVLGSTDGGGTWFTAVFPAPASL